MLTISRLTGTGTCASNYLEVRQGAGEEGSLEDRHCRGEVEVRGRTVWVRWEREVPSTGQLRVRWNTFQCKRTNGHVQRC